MGNFCTSEGCNEVDFGANWLRRERAQDWVVRVREVAAAYEIAYQLPYEEQQIMKFLLNSLYWECVREADRLFTIDGRRAVDRVWTKVTPIYWGKPVLPKPNYERREVR